MGEQGRHWRAWRQPGAWSLTGYPAPRQAPPTPGDPLRVVLVDDSAEVRALVRAQLRLTGVAVVEGESSDGTDAIDLARRLEPDAMLLDVSMPGLDGLAALPQGLECSPGTRVVMFSGFDEEALALRALQLGATSYVLKSSSLDDVLGELLGGAAPEDDRSEGARQQPADDSAELLDQQVERFQGVFDDAAIGMATLTLQGSVVRANDSLCRIVGRSAAELLGSAYGEAVH